jgi:hypothetical protein
MIIILLTVDKPFALIRRMKPSTVLTAIPYKLVKANSVYRMNFEVNLYIMVIRAVQPPLV